MRRLDPEAPAPHFVSSLQVANPKGAPNILLSTNVFAPVKFSPPEFRINDQTADQAFWVSVTLAKSPLAPVDVLIDPASAERGSMTITSLTFDANTWDQPQYFVFEPSEDSPRGESYNLVFTLTSSDDAYNGLETYFQVTDERQKRGEDLSHPLEIRELPFLDSRDTAQYTHIYNYDCSEWGDSGNAPDVVYLYQPKKDIVLDINLCESTYDSKVFVLRNGDQDNVFGCNDDICGYQSRLRIKLLAGDDYFIIIDGYDGDSGRYVLQIREITGLAVEKIPPGEVDETLNPLPELPPLETASDVELLSLALTNCDLRPVFSPAVDSYSCTMPPGRPETSVTYATANMASTVQVINQSLQNGRRRVLEDGDATEVEANDVTASTGGYTQLQLQEGQNRVIITVMSPDLERQRSYEVVVKLMSEARETRLKSLTVKEDGPSGLLSSLLPPFSFDHFEYEAAIAWRTEALWFAVEPLSKNPHVTVAVGGQVAIPVRLQLPLSLPLALPHRWSEQIASAPHRIRPTLPHPDRNFSSQVLQWRDVGMGGEPGPLSASVPIQSGRSAMEIKVTAADGETTAAYSVSVSRETRQPAGEAVNCEVTAWGPWQPCSRQCGGGVQLRKREVSVYPRNSGLACPALVDERMCNEFACRLDCSVSPWGQWSQCSTRCGDGFQIRTRYVLDFPSGGGGQCPDLTEQRPCEIPPDECFRDADCRLGAWGIWTECSAPCGGGTQTRERAVVSPQLGNGRPCSVTQEVRPCNVHECDSECQVTDWGRWGPCDSACGPGEQHRWRSVVGVPSNGSPAQCPALRESRPCTSPVCLPGQQPYPSDTSQDVVPGSSPPPSYSLDSISDDEGMFRDLPGRIEPPKHRWLIYGFGACSSTCGGGVQTRTVQCARIEGEGWEISDPRACETEGAGPQPSSTRACNVEACEGATSLVSEWQSCSATCGWGARERAVSCKGLLGLLLPRSSCLQEKEEAFEPCATNDCPRSEPYWRLGSWGRCSVHCGGGTASRDATCIDPLLNAETTPERCGPPPSPLERPCNTRPCRVGVWRAGPWGSCSSTCSSKGSMSRDVRCVALDSDGEQPLDDRECLATGAAKPKDTAQCGKVSCGGCGAHSRCSGNGACWDAKLVHSDAEPGHTACACSPGFLGDTCEVPPGCLSGVVDSAGRCCSGAVGRRGQCCTSGAAVDFEGQCCKSGVLDACGVCDGPSIAVDVAGSCCPGPLDAAGLCCPSGHLDECGVCDGDGTTCALVLDLVFVLSPALELSNLLDTGDGRRFLEEEAKAFVAEKLGLRGGGSVSPESGTAKVTEIHVFETGHDFVLNAQVEYRNGHRLLCPLAGQGLTRPFGV